MKKIPIRTCVVTGVKLEKNELIRVVKTKDGKVLVDETGKCNGRGAYLKKDLCVFDKAEKSKILNKNVRAHVKIDTGLI